MTKDPNTIPCPTCGFGCKAGEGTCYACGSLVDVDAWFGKPMPDPRTR